AYVIDRSYAILDERTVCFSLLAADRILHLDLFELDELFGRQMHCLPIRIVGIGATLLRLLALIFGKFLLLLGLNALLLRCRLDTLMLDRIGRVSSTDSHCNQSNRQLLVADKVD